jgi:argininosuccinate lyase
MEGLAMTRACLRVLAPFIESIRVHRDRLLAGFTPDVFATDRALELVGQGMPFRDAYHYVKEHLDELVGLDPVRAIEQKTHLGAPLGIDWELLGDRLNAVRETVREERRSLDAAVKKLMRG